MSVPTLNRGLRAEGASWRDISGGHRLRAAARLLRESRRSIADIALAAGYAESASFTRAFRRAYGTSPLRYRRGESGVSSR
jgi:transcriptional regulator GlxA family with amidase domain